MTNEKPLEHLVGGYSNTAIFRTMAFVGDSLSSGEFELVDADGTHRYYDMFEYSWGQFLARKNGLKGYNFSKGGMTAKRYIETFADKFDLWNKEKACQAYVIALGVNDLGQNMEIGGAEDITATEFEGERPFISYYAEIVRRYKEISPDAKFFFVTIPRTETESMNEKRAKVADALYALAEHFDNAYVIDLFRDAPLFDAEFRKGHFLWGHMNPMGYIYIANLVDSYIDYIVRTHPDEFKTVGFIGTDIKYK